MSVLKISPQPAVALAMAETESEASSKREDDREALQLLIALLDEN